MEIESITSTPSPPPSEASAQIAALLIAAVAIGASVGMIRWVFQRVRQGEPLVPRRSQEPVPWGGNDVLVVTILFLCIPVCLLGWLPKPAEVSEGPLPMSINQLLGNSAAMILATVAAISYLRARGASWASFGFTSTEPLADCQRAVAGIALIVAPLLTLAAVLDRVVPYHHQIVDFLASHRDPAALAVVFVSAVIVAPIVEEFFFRRVLQGWLEKRQAVALYGVRSGESAIAISALCFALLHVGQGLAWVPLAFFGVVVGYLARQTGSLLAGIFLHAIFNAISVVLVVAAGPPPTGGS
ncbi:MAG: type II CAAX endopeptidase family protein [Planctomycetia bacterium]|nr:type II CAAX endopeptidase family protein [Planctomycetia bacterium]